MPRRFVTIRTSNQLRVVICGSIIGALGLTALIVGAAGAQAAHHGWANCGAVSPSTGGDAGPIKAKRVRCKDAQILARDWLKGQANPKVHGVRFRCRAYSPPQVHCGHRRKRVRFPSD
jgi:hypothetical protein